MKNLIVLSIWVFMLPSYIYAQAVGIGTTTPNPATVLHVDAAGSTTKGMLFTGTYNDVNGTVPNLGAGSRVMFYPAKGAFRAGVISTGSSATSWDDINVGLRSVALGSNNISSGFTSTALGYFTKASGQMSTAMGAFAVASGGISFSLGSGTVAKGAASTVIGIYNDSILALDQNTIVPTTPLFIIGNGSGDDLRSNAMVVLKNGNVGIGINATDASALLHVSTGTNYNKGFLVSGAKDLSATVPSLNGGNRMMYYPGKGAFRVGGVFSTEWNNANVGQYSTGIGFGTIASGEHAVAIGYKTEATEKHAMAIGYLTKATGFAATALSYANTASGDGSTVTGFANVSRGFASTVVGTYNDPILSGAEKGISPSTPLFIVGNGASGALSNAMVVLKNGNIGIGSNAPEGNLVLNAAVNPIFQLQNAGIDKGFVQLSGDNLRIGVNGTNPTGNVVFRLNTGDRFTIFPTGNATLTGTLTQNSDERFKQDITPINDALDKVMQLNGYEYHWKPELQRDSALQIGLIAQNVEKVLPQLVATDKEGTKSVAYQNMVPVLIEAMKMQQQQIQKLEAKIQALTSSAK
jgi:hypothetical protein